MTAAAAGLHDGAAAHAALGRLYACSVRQAALAALYTALLVAGACWLERYAWLALFGAILLPMALASCCLLGARTLLGARLRWPGAWAILVLALAAGAALVPGLYEHAMALARLPGMAGVKVLAAAFAVGALGLGLPLWHAQVQCRAHYLAGLRQAALAAELKALQAQIEPHFLYNTLANTRYLARHDPGKAADMLEHLIAYLHSALPDMRAAVSTLGREFELAGHYLALMAIRFGDRLSYRLDCPAALAAAPVPPLMLMTLVENAVRHGLEPQPGPVCIRLSALAHEGGLRITVADDGAGPAHAVLGSGVGLRNLRERLAALYGDGARFSLARSAAGVTEALLVLPLETSEAAAR